MGVVGKGFARRFLLPRPGCWLGGHQPKHSPPGGPKMELTARTEGASWGWLGDQGESRAPAGACRARLQQPRALGPHYQGPSRHKGAPHRPSLNRASHWRRRTLATDSKTIPSSKIRKQGRLSVHQSIHHPVQACLAQASARESCSWPPGRPPVLGSWAVWSRLSLFFPCRGLEGAAVLLNCFLLTRPGHITQVPALFAGPFSLELLGAS